VLRLFAEDGAERVEIEVTPAGPVLRLRSSLAVSLEGGLSIDAETISLRARSALEIVSGGDLTMNAAGALQSVGRTQHLSATLGDLRLSANDDVVVEGERIKLNS
jgi:hypothetical protein